MNINKLFQFTKMEDATWLEDETLHPLYYALKMGIRYLEIDVWEGEFEIIKNNGEKDMIIEPCIIFGPTNNSKLKFKHFLSKINEEVFREN